jgi:hypothetical protein
MNIGHSSKLQYDGCYYGDNVLESTSPGTYRLEPFFNYNPKGCLQTIGPIGFGVNTTTENCPALSQQMVDVESVLSNRNVPLSRCRKAQVNDIDVTQMKSNAYNDCNGLTPEWSRLVYPAYNYKGAQLNRFFNLPKDPQENIFYDFSVNTVLEAKDNFVASNRGVYRQPSPVIIESAMVKRSSSLNNNCNIEPYSLNCASSLPFTRDKYIKRNTTSTKKYN